ncbi:zinc finger protein 711-like [Saccostrea echinata]|uniref:zinc finger protein 711-like n=1 Tax=Saccostrea echinata TaxID=191078 RepID=UPI002A8313AC|nr:zinc finger protein 711-like [Saccostrea echinata]
MTHEVNISVPGLGAKLSDVLYLYQQNRILCDCCIQCSDGEVYAHKIILAMWGMFGFYIDTIDTIQALGFTTADVNNFMKLIYSGKNFFTYAEALEMCRFGNHIGVNLLVPVCVSLNSQEMTIDKHLETVITDFMSSGVPGVYSNTLHVRFESSYNRNIMSSANVRCKEPQRDSSQSVREGHHSPDVDMTEVKEEDQWEVAEGESSDDVTVPQSEQVSMTSQEKNLAEAGTDDTSETNENRTKDITGEQKKVYKNEEETKSQIHSNLAFTESTGNLEQLEIHARGKDTDYPSKITRRIVKTILLTKCKHCRKMKLQSPFLYNEKTMEGKEKFKLHCAHSHELARLSDIACDICGFSYKRCTAETYMDHRVRKHGVTDYDTNVFTKKYCDVENCQFWAICRCKVKVHKEKVHLSQSAICNICGAVLKNSDSLRSHVLQHKETSHQCEICGKTLTTRTGLKVHIEAVHEGKYKSVGFCSHCNKSFRARYTYFNHMYREHKEIPQGMKGFHCGECDFVTPQKSMMKSHELRHKELKGIKIEKKHKCQICAKAFFSEVKRNSHVQEYHVKKVYQQCPYDNCNKVFYKERNLLTHVRALHEIGKVFQCHACPYKCNRQGNLVKHIRTVHKEDVSTQHSRRKQAMLSGKGYHEAVGQILRENPEDGKGSEEEGDTSL